MTTDSQTQNDDSIQSLAESLRGSIVTPEAESYDEVRQIWNGLIDKHPTIIAQCQGAADVAKTIEFANDQNIDYSVRSGGHHVSGSSVIDEGVVIDLSEMNSVNIDPKDQVARVEPGCRISDVLLEAQHYGLATPTGSAGRPGISGTTLGGGIGWTRRKHGLAIDALRSVDVVTQDGELVHASHDENDDLFWALRGGGGNFGIVTSFEFELVEIGPIVSHLGVFYPADNAEMVLKEFRELSQDAPEEISAVALRTQVPDLPPVPDELAGSEAIAIMGCYAGDVEKGQEAFEPYREIAEPLMDMSDPMPYMMLHQLGSMLYPDGRNYCHRSVFVDDLTNDVIDQIITGASNRPNSLSGITAWHMGGAVATNSGGAFPWRDKEYMLHIEANWDEGHTDEHMSWVWEMDDAFRELGGVGAYSGYVGVTEQEDEDWAELVYGDNRERLADIKAKYDASNTLDNNVNVPPSSD